MGALAAANEADAPVIRAERLGEVRAEYPVQSTEYPVPSNSA
jgi:hypothetical protein